MPIDQFPLPPPSSSDPANFSARADSMAGHLPTVIAQMNSVAGEVNDAAAAAVAAAASALSAPGTHATSATSLTVGTGTKTLTIQTGKEFVVGQFVVIASTALPATNWMAGQISAHNSGTGALTVEVTSTGGSGTAASWRIGLTAQQPSFATAAELRMGAANGKAVTPDAVRLADDWVTMAAVSLAFTLDMSAGINFVATLTGASSMIKGTTRPGRRGRIAIVQDAQGGRTLTWQSTFKFPGGVLPVLSTAANAIDVVDFQVAPSSDVLCIFHKGFA